MGCGSSSSAEKAPPPSGPCTLTPQLISTFMDKGYNILNDKQETVMLLGRGSVTEEKEDWQQAVVYEAKSMIDDSLLMYITSETACFNMHHMKNGAKSNPFQNWDDELTGWKDAEAEEKYTNVKNAMGQVQHYKHFCWQIEFKSTIFSDAEKSMEKASIAVKGQGDTWSPNDEDEWDSHFTKGLKYTLVVDGQDVPLELEGIDPCGLKWTCPLFTVEWTAKEFGTKFAYRRTGDKETNLVTIEKEGDEALLGAILGSFIASEFNPFDIMIRKVESRILCGRDKKGHFHDQQHSI